MNYHIQYTMYCLQILDSIDLLSRYTKLNVEVETIGSTYEKRQEKVHLIFLCVVLATHR